jgi:hypothetical protein
MKMATLGDKLGLPARSSPLLQKAERMGLNSPALLEGLAVARGCWHYRSPETASGVQVAESDFSNEELAVALLSPSLPYSPRTIRIGGAMLGATGNDAQTLARLAVQEQSVAPARYIATVGLRFEPDNPFWRQLLEQLPETEPPKNGIMPHPTRFVSMTGITRAGIGLVTVWVRPRSELSIDRG